MASSGGKLVENKPSGNGGKPSLHMVGNAHLDPVWLWPWQEGFQAAKATFRSALDRLAEYEDFVFTSSSAAIYAWVEQNDPAMFDEIRQRVFERRWVICGGWWIQPDCNIPSGESFVRQGLYGQRYFREKLGVMARVGYNPDSFGHNAMLPQILSKSGMDSYVFMRPQPHEMTLPSRLFWWESNDGSRVLAFRIPFEYCTWGRELESHVARCAAELKAPLDELMCFYGVGNHGGGPTRENIDSIHELNSSGNLPALLFSSPNQYFDSVRERNLPLPVVHVELQHHASGCYSAESNVKRWNRRAENALISAEKLSAIASYTTRLPYPQDFAHAWKDVLFNQFHDILAGTSIRSAYEDARDLYGEAMAIAGRNQNGAVQSLAWNVDIPFQEGMRPIVVFNPHSWQAKMPVDLEFGRLNEDDALLDEVGNAVPFQRVQSEATVQGGRNRICFVADLPPMGYRTFRMLPQSRPEELGLAGVGDTTLENDMLRLELDPETGHISSLYDKRSDFEMLRRPSARAVVVNDQSDTWSHGVLRFDNIIGEFEATRVRSIEHGPVRSTLRVTSEYGASRLVQDIALYTDLPYVVVRATVDWREQFKALKLRFTPNLRHPTATYEIPYGFLQRPGNSEEEPGQNWVDLSGPGVERNEVYGLSLLNDCKYSFDVQDDDLGLTVLRSPIYAHHDPYVPDPDGEYEFTDQGIQRFTYVLLPHPGSWESAGTVRRGQELNQPPVSLVETYHEGKLPREDSFLTVEGDNAIVSAVKRAEDEDALVLRCYETSGTSTSATIRLPRLGREIAASFGPSEIKTFVVPADSAQPVRETNLLEWDEGAMEWALSTGARG